eukprot:7010878-Prymnesium_polylepis.1
MPTTELGRAVCGNDDTPGSQCARPFELWTAVTSPRSVLQQLPSKARGRRPNFTRAAAGAAAERAASPSNGSLRNQRPTWDDAQRNTEACSNT